MKSTTPPFVQKYLAILFIMTQAGNCVPKRGPGIFLLDSAIRNNLPETYDSELVFPTILSLSGPLYNIEGQTIIAVETSQYGQLLFRVKKVGDNKRVSISVVVKDEPTVEGKNLLMLQRKYLYEGNLTAPVTGQPSLENYPVSLIFQRGRMHTIFNIDDHQFAIYPASNESANNSHPYERSDGKFSTYPHFFIKYRLENSSIIITKDSPTHPDATPPSLDSEVNFKVAKQNEDILRVPHLIEGALFVDERDLKNISEETIALIGEKLTKIFDVLADSVNIRFKLVDWFSYPADLVIDNDMVGCQRKLEKYIMAHPLKDTFDVGMLISTRAIEKIKRGYIVGWANVGTMCKREHSALVSWYKPTTVQYFLAHELAHLLNSYHDEEKECEPGSQLDDQPKMDSKLLVRWSNCTIKIISERVRLGKLNCLLVENSKTNKTRSSHYFK